MPNYTFYMLNPDGFTLTPQASFTLPNVTVAIKEIVRSRKAGYHGIIIKTSEIHKF